MSILGHYNYWVAIAIMMIGFYGVIAKRNLVKQAIALGIFQTGVFLFYVSMGVFKDESGRSGGAPVWEVLGHDKIEAAMNNPLPHVLMLTAIVVSVSTLAVAVALIINIQRQYRSTEESDILALDEDLR